MFVVVDVGSVLGEFSDKLQSFFFTETLEFSVFSSFSFSNRRLLEKRRPVIGKRLPWRPSLVDQSPSIASWDIVF